MTKFNKYTCPKCNSNQLQPITNTLIIKISCNNCNYTQLLSNILGSK